MRITIRPSAEPQREIDLTQTLISAIAEELWRLYGRNDQLNWLKAERHLEEIVSSARGAAVGSPADAAPGDGSAPKQPASHATIPACPCCFKRGSRPREADIAVNGPPRRRARSGCGRGRDGLTDVQEGNEERASWLK